MSFRESASAVAMVNKSTGNGEYVPLNMNDFELDFGKNEVSDTTVAEFATEGAGSTRFNYRRLSLALFAVTILLFIVTSSIVIFGQECKLSLCNVDKSSQAGTRHKNATLDFDFPSKYVWAAFSVSFVGAAVFALYAFLILRDDLASNMAKVIRPIQRAVRIFLFQEYKLLLVILVLLFTLPSISLLWASAACFLIGAVLSAVLGFICSTVSVRGGQATAFIAQDSIHEGLAISLRTGSMIGIATVSLGMGGLTACYLLFQDVRALLGFALGVSASALLARVAGGLYLNGANVGSDSDLFRGTESMHDIDPPGERYKPASMAKSVGEVLANISGMATDLMSSHVMSVIATAVLGASLPYFHENSYAMCVYNHLGLDETCVAYDTVGKKSSFAASVCRLEDFHTRYPGLSLWQSNSLFVAVPFILGLVSILITAFCSITFFVSKPSEVPELRSSNGKILWSALFRLRLNVLVSAGLTIIFSAVICFVLFGKGSSFRKAHSNSFDKYALQPLTSTNAESRCRPLAAQDGIGKTGFPDLRLIKAPYRPIRSFGNQYPTVSQVPWRLFACLALGAVFGLLQGLTTEVFQLMVKEPTREKMLSLDQGRGALTTEALGMSMMSTFIPVVVLLVSVSASSQLFGTYGVGLCALGFLSSVGSVASFEALRPVCETAKTAVQGRFASQITLNAIEVIRVIANSAGNTVRGVSAGAAALSSLSLLAVLIQESGLIPSPRQLVGVITGKPSKHITDFVDISVVDIYVLVSTLLGLLLPCVFAAMTMLSGNQASLHMISEALEFVRSSRRSQQDPRATNDHHQRCMGLSAASSSVNSILPIVTAVMAPLVVGFGFGSKALVAFTAGSISASFLLSVVLNNTGGSLMRIRSHAQSRYREADADAPAWQPAIRTGESLGERLIDCCAPCSVAVMKLVTSLAVIEAPLTKTGIQKGWIGLILLFGTVAAMAALALFLRRRRRSNTPQYPPTKDVESPEECSAPKMNPSFVSPFYEETPCVNVKQVSSQSAFAFTRHTQGAVGYSSVSRKWSPYEPSGSYFDDSYGINTDQFPDSEDEEQAVEYVQVNL